MPNRSSRPPRRGQDPRPYPGAPSRTRPHHARPGTTRSRSDRASGAAAIPCSVWAPVAPVDPALTWPPVVVRQITTAFSEHGARVGLLPWPTAGTDLSGEHPPALDEQADDALVVIDKLGRTGFLDHLPYAVADSSATAGSQSFWAPLITPSAHHTPAPGPLAEPLTDLAEHPAADLDLIITSLAPGDSGDPVSDLVARHAARRLRSGGLLTVLTHSEQSEGALLDPIGTVVAAGQNADLLYLQHLVVLHTPLHRRTELPSTARHTPGPARTPVHQRAHSDLLVFAQPTEATALDPVQQDTR